MAKASQSGQPKEPRSLKRARKAENRAIHDQAKWVLLALGALFVVICLLVWYIASNKPGPASTTFTMDGADFSGEFTENLKANLKDGGP